MLLRLGMAFLLVTVLSFAYTDMDMDGVDDSLDRCLNTSFDDVVDTYGCSLDKLFPGKLIMQIGSDTSFNQLDNTVSNLNLYANYMFENWNFSIANTNYFVTNLSTDTSENNLYLTTGYTYTKENTRTRFSLGSKFDLKNKGRGKRKNDFYASVNFEYFFKQKHNVFLYYSYTLSGDSDVLDYEDFHSSSAGYGYHISDKWYTAFSYNFSTNSYPGVDDYRALSWFNSYHFTASTYATLNYAHTFDDISYSHIVTFSLGVYFD